MNEELLKIMSKMQKKAVNYKFKSRNKMSFNDDDYYSYWLPFDLDNEVELLGRNKDGIN